MKASIYSLLRGLAVQSFLLDRFLELYPVIIRRSLPAIGAEQEEWFRELGELRSELREALGGDVGTWLEAVDQAERVGLFGNLADELVRGGDK